MNEGSCRGPTQHSFALPSIQATRQSLPAHKLQAEPYFWGQRREPEVTTHARMLSSGTCNGLGCPTLESKSQLLASLCPHLEADAEDQNLMAKKGKKKKKNQPAEHHAVTKITTPAGGPCSYTAGFQDSKVVTEKDKPVPFSPLPKAS